MRFVGSTDGVQHGEFYRSHDHQGVAPNRLRVMVLRGGVLVIRTVDEANLAQMNTTQEIPFPWWSLAGTQFSNAITQVSEVPRALFVGMGGSFEIVDPSGSGFILGDRMPGYQVQRHPTTVVDAFGGNSLWLPIGTWVGIAATLAQLPIQATMGATHHARMLINAIRRWHAPTSQWRWETPYAAYTGPAGTQVRHGFVDTGLQAGNIASTIWLSTMVQDPVPEMGPNDPLP
jgi:hypothetical protein